MSEDDAQAPRAPGLAVMIVGAVTACANLVLVSMTWGLRGHGGGMATLGIAVVVSPWTNLAIAVASLLCTPLARRYLGVSIGEHVTISLGLPLLGAAATFLTILFLQN